jgi:hypothetical protein
LLSPIRVALPSEDTTASQVGRWMNIPLPKVPRQCTGLSQLMYPGRLAFRRSCAKI